MKGVHIFSTKSLALNESIPLLPVHLLTHWWDKTGEIFVCKWRPTNIKEYSKQIWNIPWDQTSHILRNQNITIYFLSHILLCTIWMALMYS